MASKEPATELETRKSPADSTEDVPKQSESTDEEQTQLDEASAEQEATEIKTTEDDKTWQAVFSPEANAWYFWNSKTNETTWENPREPGTTTTTATSEPSTSTSLAPEQPPLPTTSTSDGLPPIDPDLAWLDPTRAGGATSTQAARFNARTGRFQVQGHHLTPDRISDYQRSHRQQEAYYDVKGWEQQLEGKGLKRSIAGVTSEPGAGEGTDETPRKRPSSKQVEKFKQQKQEKKKKKLTSWLAN